MYLKGIQAGIQAAHSQTELCMKAIKQDIPEDHLLDLLAWSRSPTMIVKNGGGNEEMMHFHSMVERSSYPWASFFEPGLGGVLTSITVVLPDVKKICERVYMNGVDMGRPGLDGLLDIDQMMINELNRMRSAN